MNIIIAKPVNMDQQISAIRAASDLGLIQVDFLEWPANTIDEKILIDELVRLGIDFDIKPSKIRNIRVKPDYRIPRLAGLIKRIEMQEAGRAIKEAKKRLSQNEVVKVGLNHYHYMNNQWRLIV